MAGRRSKKKIKQVKHSLMNDEKVEADFLKQYGDMQLETPCPKPSRISLVMIARRNLPAELSLANAEPQSKIIDSLTKISHVRLDRENIKHIDNLEMLGPVTNLYLQENMIEKIENLESLLHLRFLTLSGNAIQKVENLSSIETLKFLDLSYNLITHLDTGELPRSLIIVNLTGNECTKDLDYRNNVVKSLPNLKQLDNCDVITHDGLDVSESSEEEIVDNEDDISLPECIQESDNTDDLFLTSNKMIRQSRARVVGYCKTHDAIVNELEEFRSHSGLTMSTARSNASSQR